MPSVLWMSLPDGWKLTEVQAGLQVMIALLCTWGIFAFSRFCWQLSSNLVKKNRSVALASLMSINTIGEAFDIIILLKRRIFRLRYWKLLAQSIVVISLTVATIISGPIAKASTRLDSIVRTTTIPGLLATTDFDNRRYANVVWNDTLSSLNYAGFPMDQLLDFMPQHNSSWIYEANEWANHTWSMTCNRTENTPITLVDSGKCQNMSVELPATNEFFGYNKYDDWSYRWEALYDNYSSPTWVQDGLIMFVGTYYTGWDQATQITYNMSVILASMYLHGLPAQRNYSSSCNFGVGQAESASYAKVECFLSRPQQIPDERFQANPGNMDWDLLAQAYPENYFDRFQTESNDNTTISILTSDDLIRFYQTYMITKDYQHPQKVERSVTANVPVVQLSSTFIAFGSLYALAVILGLVNYAIFIFKNKDVARETPESKLDWIVQSIIDESDLRRTTTNMSRRSVIAPSHRVELPATEKVRTAFENAKYGGSTVEELPLADHLSPPAGHQFDQSPNTGYRFPMNSAPYVGYQAGPIPDYDISAYEASYAQAPDPARGYGIQNPTSIFTSDRRRGYDRLA